MYTHRPPNPILAEFRLVDDGSGDYAFTWLYFLCGEWTQRADYRTGFPPAEWGYRPAWGDESDDPDARYIANIIACWNVTDAQIVTAARVLWRVLGARRDAEDER